MQSKKEDTPYKAKTESDVKREQIVSVLMGVSTELSKLSRTVSVNPTAITEVTDNITEIISTRMEAYTTCITESVTQFNRILGELDETISSMQEFTTAEEKGFGEIFSSLKDTKTTLDTLNASLQQMDRSVSNLNTNTIKNLEKLTTISSNLNTILTELKKPADTPKITTKDRTIALIQEQSATNSNMLDELYKLKTLNESINNDIQLLKVNRIEPFMEQLKSSQGGLINSLKTNGDKLVEVIRSDSQTIEAKLSHILSLQQEQLTKQQQFSDMDELKTNLLKVNELYRDNVQDLEVYKLQLSEANNELALLRTKASQPLQDTDLENKILKSQVDKLLTDHKTLNDEFIALRILYDGLLVQKKELEEQKVMGLMESK